MGIFDKFNNQDLGDEEAFEELCCQLFETWGMRAMGFDNTWTYRDIRGDGGDGGIEAYWFNMDLLHFFRQFREGLRNHSRKARLWQTPTIPGSSRRSSGSRSCSSTSQASPGAS